MFTSVIFNGYRINLSLAQFLCLFGLEKKVWSRVKVFVVI